MAKKEGKEEGCEAKTTESTKIYEINKRKKERKILINTLNLKQKLINKINTEERETGMSFRRCKDGVKRGIKERI